MLQVTFEHLVQENDISNYLKSTETSPTIPSKTTNLPAFDQDRWKVGTVNICDSPTAHEVQLSYTTGSSGDRADNLQLFLCKNAKPWEGGLRGIRNVAYDLRVGRLSHTS